MRAFLVISFSLFSLARAGVAQAAAPAVEAPADSLVPAAGAAPGSAAAAGEALAADSAGGTEKALGFKQKVKRTGSLLYRFVKAFDDYDTDYISPNYYNYSAMLQNTNFYQVYRFRGTNEAGEEQSLSMSPVPAFKVGPYFGWRWIFLGYTFDMSHPKRARKMQEFSLSLYSAMLGCDLVYVRNDGEFRLKRVTGFEGVHPDAFCGTEFDGMRANTFSLNAYYVFNHRHFSYPAGFAQSTVQRKSAGSWMLGFRFDHHDLAFDYTSLPAALIGTPGDEKIIDELKLENIDYYNYSVNVGYAYNWVFARNWLLSASVAPALGFRRAKGAKLRGDELWVSLRKLNFDVLSRAGIVWNNTHFYAGASVISHFFDYRKARFQMLNTINYFNIYFGFNFHRKRQYRAGKR